MFISQRFCQIDKKYIEPFQQIFIEQYETIHRLETNKLRNVAKFFAHLLYTDAISWGVRDVYVIWLPSFEQVDVVSKIFVVVTRTVELIIHLYSVLEQWQSKNISAFILVCLVFISYCAALKFKVRIFFKCENVSALFYRWLFNRPWSLQRNLAKCRRCEIAAEIWKKNCIFFFQTRMFGVW